MTLDTPMLHHPLNMETRLKQWAYPSLKGILLFICTSLLAWKNET
jgi:hypothetical protein